MDQVLNTIVPVFGLIALGFAAARTGIMSADAGQGVAAFVFTLAMPAFLFRTVATTDVPQLDSFGILTGFLGAAALTWVLLTIAAVSPALRRTPREAAAISMAGVFGNTVMLGIPICVAHYGERALGPLAVLVAIHAPLLWIAASVQIAGARPDTPLVEDAPSTGQSRFALLRSAAVDLVRNPILIGIVAGAVWRQTGLGIPATLDTFIGLLGQAGIPGALTALGLSLARYELGGQRPTLVAIIVAKLLILPLLAYGLCTYVLSLDPLSTGVVVILSACPTGANAFLFASRYDTAVASVSSSVALGTALSAGTISVLLILLG
ncbi:MAG: AEC family transporter [Pseudomonadota bacterium]